MSHRDLLEEHYRAYGRGTESEHNWMLLADMEARARKLTDKETYVLPAGSGGVNLRWVLPRGGSITAKFDAEGHFERATGTWPDGDQITEHRLEGPCADAVLRSWLTNVLLSAHR